MTTNIQKIIDRSQLTGDWDFERYDLEVHFDRRRAQPGDGYPHLVVVTHEANGIATGGYVMTDYGSAYDLGEGPYKLGTRNLTAVLVSIDSAFRYKTFFDAWAANNPATLSEKHLADSVNESERQIRNARIMGHMNGYLADKLATKVLGIHPSNLFGTPGWINPQSWPGEALENLDD